MEMRKIGVLLVLLFFATARASDSFEAGLKKLEEEAYTEAVALFEAHVNQFPFDDEGYYNLGIAYYRTKDYPKGLWGFEKSLKINPSNHDAAANAAYAYQKLNLKGEWRQETGLFARIFFGVGKNFWASFTALFGGLLGLLIALNMVFRKNRFSTLLQFSAAVCTLVFISCFVFAALHKSHLTHARQGIVISATAIGKAGPDDKQKTLFTLPAGQKVAITANHDGWTQVQLNPETVGWILEEDVWGY
jgi:hypothetical protein